MECTCPKDEETYWFLPPCKQHGSLNPKNPFVQYRNKAWIEGMRLNAESGYTDCNGFKMDDKMRASNLFTEAHTTPPH